MNQPVTKADHHVHFKCTSAALSGIVAAGFVYPSCVAAIIFAASGSWIQFSVERLVEVVFTACMFALFAGLFGFIVSSLTGFLAIFLVYFMNRSVGYPIGARMAAISAGSLAGYVPTVWILFVSGSHMDLFMAGTLGPFLATILGACGAALSCKHYAGIEYEIARYHPKYRPTVSHLLIATTWIAVTFAICNFVGGLEIAIAAGAWFALQGLILVAAMFSRRLS